MSTSWNVDREWFNMESTFTLSTYQDKGYNLLFRTEKKFTYMDQLKKYWRMFDLFGL